MKQLYFFFLHLCVFTMISFSAVAQFTLSAEIRPRAEFRNGFKTPIKKGDDPAFFIEQRTRLYANYQSEKFDVAISVQDVRIWGSTSQVYKEDPSLFNLYEAYGTYKITSAHHISFGRMALDYDNARILGNLDWAQQGRSHDLLKYSFIGSSFKLDVGAAFNQDASTPEFSKLTGSYYSGVNNYKTMQYAWAHKQFDKGKISFLALNNGVQYAPDTVYFSQTIGTYAVPQIGKSSLELEAYYQGGKDGSGRKLNAYMLSAAWSFLKDKPVSLTAGVDLLSGDDPDTEKNEAFSPLYGTHHKFYGFMDYFYVGNGHGNKGLTDLNLKAKFKSGGNSSLLAHVHQFFSNAKVPGGEAHPGDYSSNLGTELDIVFNTTLGKSVKLAGGYSQMFQSESMDIIKGKVDTKGMQNWAWAMLVFKPTLFESTKNN
jgi:hypothetical protein